MRRILEIGGRLAGPGRAQPRRQPLKSICLRGQPALLQQRDRDLRLERNEAHDGFDEQLLRGHVDGWSGKAVKIVALLLAPNDDVI